MQDDFRRTFARSLAVVGGLVSLLGGGWSSVTVRGDEPFRDRVAPFVKTYCAECHNKKKAEGELDLTRFGSAASLAAEFRQWDVVSTFVKEAKMPPKEAKQPPAAERLAFLQGIDDVLRAEAKRVAGDPGVVLPRRLSNAEYNNTIRDLTGVDIRPADSFPIDPASGEGFSNTGEALLMTPSLFKKYYTAAQQVADHILFTPSGLTFAPHPVVTFADRQKYFEQAIIKFYEQHKIDYEQALIAAWQYQHRPASEKKLDVAGWAVAHGHSPRYLRLLWETLHPEPALDNGYLRLLRSRFAEFPAPSAATPLGTATVDVPNDVKQRARALASDIQRLSKLLTPAETPAIVSNAGNGPIQHIDRRKKTAAARDTFDRSLLRTSQRLHLEIKNLPDKPTARVQLRATPAFESDKPGYVLLSGLNLSTNGPNNYNAKDAKKNTNLLAWLAEHAPDAAKKLTPGKHPAGTAIDSETLVLPVPGSLDFELPVKALVDLKSINLFVEAALDRASLGHTSARLELIERPTPASDTAKSVDSGSWTADRPFPLIDASHPQASPLAAACERLCRVFPNRFFYVDDTRGLSAGFHLIEGFFRDDQPLYRAVLTDDEQRQLDRMWDELTFGTGISEKMLRGFVFFERSERNFLKHPDFNSIKEEDPDLIKDENIVRFEEIYLARSNVKGTSAELEAHPIHTFFLEIRNGLKRRAAVLKDAAPRYLKQLHDLATLAYRRPLTQSERAQLDAFFEAIASKEEFGTEQAVKASLTRLLVSPYFCYRADAPPQGNTVQPLTDLALASRLSYFLWASMPDETLLKLAKEGKLRDEAVLKAQVKRMLADPKVQGMTLEFLGQWLQYRDFPAQEGVDRKVFPAFDDALRQAMFEEPTRLAAHLIQHDRPVTDLLDGDITLVNKRLAQHYGLNFKGASDGWEVCDGLHQQGRAGLLGMGVFLTRNSQPQRTSPVKRGFWVVHKLLGEHIPAPPPDVAVLPAKETDTQGKSIRELLVLHTEDAKCARCHVRFDPIGLAMEGFDPIGRARTKDLAGRAIDNVVALPSGERTRGVPEFAKHLRTDRKHEFTRTLCRKFLGFALGRSLELSDQVLLEEMQTRLDAHGDRFSVLFESVVLSPQFRNQRGREFTPAAFNTK